MVSCVIKYRCVSAIFRVFSYIQQNSLYFVDSEISHIFVRACYLLPMWNEYGLFSAEYSEFIIFLMNSAAFSCVSRVSVGLGAILDPPGGSKGGGGQIPSR